MLLSRISISLFILESVSLARFLTLYTLNKPNKIDKTDNIYTISLLHCQMFYEHIFFCLFHVSINVSSKLQFQGCVSSYMQYQFSMKRKTLTHTNTETRIMANNLQRKDKIHALILHTCAR